MKPQCVAILQHVNLSDPRNVQALPGLLNVLAKTLQHLEQPKLFADGHDNASSPAAAPKEQQALKQAQHQLANYIFFPFSQFLQVNNIKILRAPPAHQSVFRTFLQTLSILIDKCDLEKAIHEQLWTFVGLTLGGPLGSKNFEHDWNDSVRRGLVEIWNIILQKSYKRSEELDIPGPIVAHTLNTLLLVLEDKDTEQETRIETLQFLDSFVTKYLEHEDKVPQYLPGIVSTLVKVIIAHQKSGRIVVEAIKPLSSAIRASLNETRCEALDLYDAPKAAESVAQPTSLEDLFANSKIQELAKATQGPFDRSNDISEIPDEIEDKPITAAPSAEPGQSQAWLKATASQIQRALLSLLPILRYHENAEVRQALVQLASTQLKVCFKSLSRTTARLLLEELLVCSRDTWEQVSDPASRALHELLGRKNNSTSNDCSHDESDARTPLQSLVSNIVLESITSLPHSIFMNGLAHEATLQRQLNLIIATLQCGASPSMKEIKIERWSLNLLRAIELAPIASTSNLGPRDETTPWTRMNQSSLLMIDYEKQQSRSMIEPVPSQEANAKHLPAFPPLKLANVAPGTTTSLLQEALQSLHLLPGAADILEHFMGIAGYADTGMPVGGTSTVASALWVVQQIMDGLAKDWQMNIPVCKRSISEIPGIALSWLNRDDLEEMEDQLRPIESDETGNDRPPQHQEADDMQSTEMQSGSLTLSGSLDSNANQSLMKPSKNVKRPSYATQVHCMALRLLASSAQLLQQGFQRYMMHVLYPVLRALCPSSESRLGIIQAHAYASLYRISAYMSYENPSKMLVSNVDYILNSISAHLRGTTTLSNGALDPLAPSVLMSVIELAGEDILPYLGDAVDEIFDALDRWHAYDLLVSELLRVLDRLVNVCQVNASEAEEKKYGRAIEEIQKMRPQPEKDMDAFEQWFKTRHDDRLRFKSEVEEVKPPTDLPEQNPREPFANLTTNNDSEELEGDYDTPADQPEAEEEKIPLTKSQALVLAILRKALYFLTHSSAFLRARVLALITSSIPILGERTSDLLPEIHRFWPYILARLDDGFERSPAFVLLEVMRLFISLIEYRGDFMNRRILKDVMPRLRSLVQRHDFRPTAKNQFTNEYRTLRAILGLVTVTLRDVPGVSGEDLWTIAILFRPFLSSTIDSELRQKASEMYQALGQLDPDLTWLALCSGLGQVQDLSILTLPMWQNDEPSVVQLLQTL